jgi:outer membrane protein OmpA-like peptidoglycan-associated protein
VLVVVFAAATTAAAQPVAFKLDGSVPVGKRPAIEVVAQKKVTEVRIELERADGKQFTVRHGALAAGQKVALSIGDGAAGKVSYKAKITVQVPGEAAWSDQLTFDTLVSAPIKVTYDADHLDLDKRVLQFKVSRAIDKADLVVIGEDGAELGTGAATFDGSAGADAWLSISWTQPAGTRVMTMKLRVAAADGAATNVQLIPWSVAIDHEDVNFKTDSAVIDPDETKKLDASLVKIADVVKRAGKFMKMQLYIAGHTDTVGPTAKNRKLSMDRAVAIARYFRKKGVTMPIAFAGFGEEVLEVKTADDTDERANRRTDYVIGPAGGAPPFKGPYLKVRADWKQLK